MIIFLEQQARLVTQLNPHPEWLYNNFEELILNCGKEMFFKPLPNNIEVGLPKQCYLNCLQLLDEHPEFKYCEGYALATDSVLPVPHAWLVNSAMEVIDPTWNNPAIYLGVTFNSNWLFSFLDSRQRKDCLAIFEGNYLENFSLLKQGLPNEAIS